MLSCCFCGFFFLFAVVWSWLSLGGSVDCHFNGGSSLRFFSSCRASGILVAACCAGCYDVEGEAPSVLDPCLLEALSAWV